jgi:hypothetical protein
MEGGAAPPRSERFAIERRLGGGASGDVYAALDRSTNERVALKVLRGDDADGLRRFKREFRALADLAHPNLVALRDLVAGESGRWLLSMELVEGADLLAATARDPGRAARLFAQVADALRYLHAHGIVHGDVKPTNVLVTRDDRAVLLDFGVSTEIARITSVGAMPRGTAGYIAPELVRGEAPTPAADWYSFGAMLFECIAGELPFEGQPFSVMYRKTTAPAPSLRDSAPEAPDALVELTAALLTTHPGERADGLHAQRVLGGAPRALSIRPRAEPPFEGRAAELTRLRDAFAGCAAEGRTPRLVWVLGESGIGKTSLARRVGEALQREGRARLFTSRCFEREELPYKAFDALADDLAARLGAAPPGDVDPADTDALAAAARLFPSLARAVPPGPRALPLDPWALRRLAALGLAVALGRAARGAAAVLILDDFQWADGESQALLDDLLRVPRGPLLVLALSRRGADDPRAADTVRLGPLDAAAAAAVVRSVVGHGGEDVSLEAVSRVVAEASGNPFLLTLLAGDGAPGDSDLAGALDRLAAPLDATSRALLNAVCVSPGELPQPVRAGLIGDAEPHARQLLVKTRLARVAERDRSALLPYHDRVRQHFAARLANDALRRTHGALADAWRALPEAPPDRVAFHLVGAGRHADAADFARRAAERAEAAFAFDRAADLYTLCLTLPGSAPELAALRVHRARCLAGAGRGPEAAEAWLRAAADARGLEAGARRRLAGEQLLRSGHIDRGLALLAEAMRGVAPIPRGRVDALAMLALGRARLAARGHGFRPRREDLCDPAALAAVDASLSVSLGFSMIDTARGAAVQSWGVLRALDLGEPSRVARALALEAGYSASGGWRAHRRTRALFARAQEAAALSDDPSVDLFVTVMSGLAAWCEGRWTDAAVAFDVALARADRESVGGSWERSTASMILLDAMAYRGEWRVISERVPQLLADAESRGDLYTATITRLRWSFLDAIARDAPDAAEAALRRVDEWRNTGFHTVHLIALHEGCEVALYRDRPDAAQALLDAGWGPLRRSLLLEVEAFRLQLAFLRGRVALARALRDPGLRGAVRDRAAELEDSDAPWARGWAWLLRGSLAADEGRRSDAESALLRARGAFAAADMEIYAQVARRALGVLRDSAAEVDAADAWMRGQRVANPARVAWMLCPTPTR